MFEKLDLNELDQFQSPPAAEMSDLELETVAAGKVRSPGGVGGPYSGLGVRPGVGFGAPGLGMRRGPG